MEYISNFTATERILKKHGFTMRKKYGQNFLIDANILEKIIREAEVGPEDVILEIGPGIGTMTQYLARTAKKVTAVEIDDNLIPILAETLADFPNASVIHEDIMKFDVDAYFASLPEEDRKHCKVVANLPYYITTPVLMKLLEGVTSFELMLFMVQKEVAERLTAGPGSKDYGALTIAAAYYTEVETVGIVSPNSFIPRPNVESALLRMRTYKDKPVSVRDEKLLFKLVRASFNQRRKTLANGIANFEGLSYSREDVTKALEKTGLPATVRGETLTLEQFAALSDALF